MTWDMGSRHLTPEPVARGETGKEACIKGGQKAAKDQMKAFMKEKGIRACNGCHSSLAPKYELKPDGLARCFSAGGK
ncbi:MAG: hypothetical protein FJ086_01465 [Deltaproteobacteria bacterium]|nr:hypothetical protein [Deltaproteobacteria bacterium]